jgi:peptidoglycan/xylan/chitin deacetylase (PgdA/CDA1 family)
MALCLALALTCCGGAGELQAQAPIVANATPIALVDPMSLDPPFAAPLPPASIVEGGPPAVPVPRNVRSAAAAAGGAVVQRPVRRIADLPGSGVGPNDKVVALTFDDGPDPNFTPQVLDVLSRYQVPATFFMIGWEAAASPDLVKRIADGGNGVGSHTWSHVDLTRQSDATLAVQVDRTKALLSSETGRTVSCLRPPQGHQNPGLVHRLSERGVTTVLWSADTRDWTRPGTETIVQRALLKLSPGTIILMHDGGGDRSQTVEALPRIIQSVQSQGYRLVPICR